MMKSLSTVIICSLGGGLIFNSCHSKIENDKSRPNILVAISDDQSFAHTGFAGCKFVNTPGFDRVARSGIYFTNCYCGSPGSAPSRGSLVTGRYHWQNEQSGQPEYSAVEQEMKNELIKELKRSGDPRVVGPDSEIFESYIRYSPIREFPKPGQIEK